MTLLAPYPDAELVVLALLESVAPTVTRTASDLKPGTILVNRIGGSDDGITDFPEIQVTCFAADRMTAWQMQEQCRQLILASPNTYPAGALVDDARTVTPAQQIPDPNTELYDPVVASYALAFRRPRFP